MILRERFMERKILLISASGLAAATVVGFGAFALTTSGSSLVSNSTPTSHVASATSGTTNGSSSTPSVGSTAPHPHWGIGRRGREVYLESVLKQSGGSYKTVISVLGTLKAISSSSISVIRPDTGATITASIASTTRFANTSESALAADLSSNTTVTVRLVETSNNAVSVSVPPPPGTHPKPGFGRFGGTFPPPNGATSNSSASA